MALQPIAQANRLRQLRYKAQPALLTGLNHRQLPLVEFHLSAFALIGDERLDHARTDFGRHAQDQIHRLGLGHRL